MGEIVIFWGTLLRQLREKHKLSQNDVAGILHISRQSYSHIETGQKKPSAEILAILSNIYNVDLFQYALNNMPESFVKEQAEFKCALSKKARRGKTASRNQTLSFMEFEDPK